MRTYEISEATKLTEAVFDRVFKEGRSFVSKNLRCQTTVFKESYARGYRTLLIQGACAGCEDAAAVWAVTGNVLTIQIIMNPAIAASIVKNIGQVCQLVKQKASGIIIPTPRRIE